MPVLANSKKNKLLAALPEAELRRWLPHLSFVQVPRGHVLGTSGARLNHVFFPTTCIVSLQSVMSDGAAAEVSVVGNEGIIGVAVFMGGQSMPGNAVVEVGGGGFQMDPSAVLEEFNRGGPVQHLLLRYTLALITQIAQTAACYRHHAIDQQLCRWLLQNLDRLHTPELLMTQERIANLLGVRRESVTEAALKLQKNGVIDYSRGRISILSRKALEGRTCECYQTIMDEYARLLPPSCASMDALDVSVHRHAD
jgi:CRP-like cAMP-binding protein